MWNPVAFLKDAAFAAAGLRGEIHGIAHEERSAALSAGACSFWVAGKELKLSYHNSETICFAIYPYDGNLD